MLKTFLGVDLKAGGQIILWLHLVENFLLFLTVAFRSHMIPNNATRDFVVNVKDYRIDVHTYFRHFLEMFSTLAICFCLLGILIRRSKLIMWLFLIHQGISLEVLIMLIPVVILKSSSSLCLLYSLPLVIFIIIKGYCWLVMLSLYKHEQKEKRRLKFGQQWIVNSLLSMQDTGVRLTIPSQPSNISYEPLSIS